MLSWSLPTSFSFPVFCVAQDKIKSLFEHTFLAPRVSLTSEPGSPHPTSATPLRIGVVLSGGQVSCRMSFALHGWFSMPRTIRP